MHDFESAHYHAADGDIIALEQSHPLWSADRVALRTVGIDIGSSTSHLIFSWLVLRRQGATLSSRFQITERKIEYASPILLTPFVAGQSIDIPKLSAFLESAYSAAGWSPESVDTGAVITTGDAARKDNADAVVQLFSRQAGKFVCASAGPRLEAKMAAYGSGAVARSVASEPPTTVLNIDVGGGTCKLTIAHGNHLHVCAVNVGARLITFDEAGVLTKIERAAAIVAKAEGLELTIGEPVSEATRDALARRLARVLLEVASCRPLSKLARELLITEPLHLHGKIDVVVFSGGVSEYIYRRDVPSFGDLGPVLALHIRAGLEDALPNVRLETPVEGIRATVIGASQFTAQVSGNTIFVGDPERLPLRNLQVVTVPIGDVTPTAKLVAEAARRALAAAEVTEPRLIGLAVKWRHGPAFAGLNALANGIAESMKGFVAAGFPIVLLLDADLAKLIGNLLATAAGSARDVLVIDGIEFRDLDYVDIGEQQPISNVVTVIVKSLVFTG